MIKKTLIDWIYLFIGCKSYFSPFIVSSGLPSIYVAYLPNTVYFKGEIPEKNTLL
jgi:hypothetical protein